MYFSLLYITENPFAIHGGVIAKTKDFLLNHILPKPTSLIMYDIIDTNSDFLDKKGFINNKKDAVHELYEYDKDGAHIISENVQSRFKD